jgi:murein DD-endopeptidase MepM/ murein hydrolase activator NlpD
MAAYLVLKGYVAARWALGLQLDGIDADDGMGDCWSIAILLVCRGGAIVPCPVSRYCLYLLLSLMYAVLMSTVSVSIAAVPTPTTYTVQSGDTLYSITKKFGLTVDEVARLNDIDNPNLIKPGYVLVLRTGATGSAESKPPATYTVQAGDTLWGISRKTGVPLTDLLQINSLRENSILHPGQVLLLESRPAEPVHPVSVTAQASENQPQTGESTLLTTQTAVPVVTPMGAVVLPVQVPTVVTDAGTPKVMETLPSQKQEVSPNTPTQVTLSADSIEGDTVPLAVSANIDRAREALERVSDPTADMQWPVSGVLTSKFGFRWGRMHEGIDLAVPVGTPVRVAADGVVIFAGWSNGYGYLVKVDHGQGWESWYAHNSELRVAVGDRALKGDVIARSGNTGNTTGPHLHFEIRKNGKAMDPLRYLP